VVIICLSQTSVSKDGYIQKEIRTALDAADEKPEGSIYLIPARLEECSVPSRLSKWQWVDLFKDNGYVMLANSLKIRMASLQINDIPTDGEVQRFRQMDNNEIMTDYLTIEQVLSLARTSISIYNNPRLFSDDWERKRERGAEVVRKLALKYEAVIDLLIADAKKYARALHTDDASPVSPNSIEMLAEFALQYTKIITFLEKILKTDYGLPRWQAIESLCLIGCPEADAILKKLVNGEYGPYPIRGYGINSDIDEVKRHKGETFVKNIMDSKS
jgi:hypothetical protein